MAKAWTCELCGTKNPPRAKHCMECGGELQDDEAPPASDNYATKEDLKRVEEKLDKALGTKAPPQPKRKRRKGDADLDDVLEWDDDDDDEDDDEEEAEEE